MNRRFRSLTALLALLALADVSCKKDDRRRHRIDDETEEEAPAHRAEARSRETAAATVPSATTGALSAEPTAVASVEPVPPAVPGAPIGPALSVRNVARVKEQWNASIGGWGHAVAISTLHSKVAASNGGLVATYELATGASARALPQSGCGSVKALGFSSTALVVVCDHGIELLDPVTLEKRKTMLVRGAEIEVARVRAPWIVASHKDGVLARYSLEGKDVLEIPVHGPTVDVESIDISRDGQRVAAGFHSGTVWAWDCATPSTEIKVGTYSTHVSSVAFSPDGATLVEEGPSFGVAAWKLDSTKMTATPAGELRTDESWTKGLFITNDGALLIAATASGYALITKGGKTELGGHEAVEDLALDEGFTVFGGVDRAGVVRVFAAR